MENQTNEETKVDEEKEHREKILKLKETLHEVIDRMVDVLDGVIVEDYIQLHIFGNDFPANGILLHDISCEVNTKSMTSSNVKHQIGFNNILSRTDSIYALDTKIGDLIIESEEKINPSSKKLHLIKKEMDQIEAGDNIMVNVEIAESERIHFPELTSNGILYVGPGQRISTDEAESLVERCEGLFNRTTAAALDRLIGLHNARITEQRINGREVVVRDAIISRNHRFDYDRGQLILNRTRPITDTELSDFLSIGEVYNYNLDSIRRSIQEHNEQYNRIFNNIEPVEVAHVERDEETNQLNIVDTDEVIESRIEANGIRVINGQIDPPEYGHISSDMADDLIGVARQINETTAILTSRIIHEHNHRLMINTLRNQDDSRPTITVNMRIPDEPGDVAQSITHEEPQSTVLQDIRIIGHRIYPGTTGIISQEDRQIMIDNANVYFLDPHEVQNIIDNHNDYLRQGEEIDHSQDPIEVFEMRSTGFSDENIRPLVEPQNGNTIEEEDDDREGTESR